MMVIVVVFLAQVCMNPGNTAASWSEDAAGFCEFMQKRLSGGKQ